MNDKNSLLRSLSAMGFTLYDLHLFLNTHPSNRDAITLYNQLRQKYMVLVADYERQFGPLTAINGAMDNQWRWVQGPWPWEYNANLEVNK